MKRMVLIFIMLAAVCCAFAGCSRNEPITGMPVSVDTAPYGDGSLSCTIYEDKVPEFGFLHIYGEPGQQPTWFWTGCDIKDAAIVAINYDEETFEPSIGDVIYSFGDVAADEGILLYMEMPEGFPTCAVTYSCADKVYCYALGYSGIDGSTTITEFEEMYDPS